jgi:hypothetical protein
MTQVSLFPLPPPLAGHPCGIHCTSARGHVCECACGGRNHGRDTTLACATVRPARKVDARQKALPLTTRTGRGQ